MKQWLDAHPSEAMHVYLAYFGTASPKYYGIDAAMLPGFFNRLQPHVPEPLTAGTYCISATLVEGIYLQIPGKWNAVFEELYQAMSPASCSLTDRPPDDPEALQKLDRRRNTAGYRQIIRALRGLAAGPTCARSCERDEPDFNVGHSILIYQLTEADVRSGDRRAAGRTIAGMRAGRQSVLGNSLNGVSRARLSRWRRPCRLVRGPPVHHRRLGHRPPRNIWLGSNSIFLPCICSNWLRCSGVRISIALAFVSSRMLPR